MPTCAAPDSVFVPFAALAAEVNRLHSPPRKAITAVCRRAEPEAVAWLLNQGLATSPAADRLARELVAAVRAERGRSSGVDALMHEFSLSSEEGVALMCLAEALLRIPDSDTADRLIADKISKGDWRKHLGGSPSMFVNAATWGLLITGKLLGAHSETGLSSALSRLIGKGGEPIIRKAVDLAMRMLGNQFVTGQTIAEALGNSGANEQRGYRYSYDMLGEAALTDADARRYYGAYEVAIHAIGAASGGRGIHDGPGMSVKLSALHPRYCRAQQDRVMRELLPRLRQLMLLAKAYDIGLNIDAEEADRLELSLDLIEALALDPALAGFDGLGVVVQAYQKRCPFVIDYLIDLSRRSGRKFMVRLVKGAYWDAEIKRAQVDGMPGYPVYTRKVHTDLSYLVCASKLLDAAPNLYPQFATHNAQTLSVIYHWARERGVDDYEFQCLHGMGESLYDQVVGKDKLDKPCRIYAPVGSHETLLAYLVRRLLENGANSSFVNQLVDEAISIDTLVADPFAGARAHGGLPHPAIALPLDLFGAQRSNSAGMDLSSEQVLSQLGHTLVQARNYTAAALIAGPADLGNARRVINPAQADDVIGTVIDASLSDVETALRCAHAGAAQWQACPPAERARLLVGVARLFELHRDELMALIIREAGKSLPNAVAEIREAVDFLRYYASQLHDASGTLALGPVVCISPWNFPLAIFTGQIAAALAAGNVVLAKPAEQTPLIACRAVQLFHEAGIGLSALQLLPGPGETIGAALCADSRVQGVIFTGSGAVAQTINRTLAKRAAHEGAEIALIAETGGQNAMIVDSSALVEQVVQDAIVSAFDSAGQRCSALRVLFLQHEIADRTIVMLKGAMQELQVGNPDRLATDIGPVIDMEAKQQLLAHIDAMKNRGKQVVRLDLAPDTAAGHFVAPTLIEIDSLNELPNEVFGPVMHVIRYRRDQLAQVLEAINASGFGLTLGVHSRIDETIDAVTRHAHVGNIYVNRTTVGAVVGVQPFGGEGKSGTGPKAGGPLYLQRLQRGAGRLPPANAKASSLQALSALCDWAVAHGYPDLSALAGQYRHTTLVGTRMLLPGPTGERNELHFASRGNVLCAASSVGVLLNQLAAILATENQALLLADTHLLLPPDLPELVSDRIARINSLEDTATPFQAALLDAGLSSLLRPALAALDGPIVVAIDTCQDQAIALERLLAERAVCVNTSAAGGNASLMTLSLQ